MVLVLGGSKGAHSINQALQAILPELLRQVQVLHISGNLEWALVEQSRNSLPVELQARYRAYPYLHKEMGAALQAADLVVSRAGASVLGEYPLFGLPAILVPYPYAWRYQRVNAQYLVRQGAAVLLNDADLGEQLLPQMQELLANRERREGMRAAVESRWRGPMRQPRLPVCCRICTGAAASQRRSEGIAMVSLNFFFFCFLILFAIIGAMRGWAKEMLVTFSAILALFIITVLEAYVPPDQCLRPAGQ